MPSKVLYLVDANNNVGYDSTEFMYLRCFRTSMRDYHEIYTDFCNTTRLRFKTFWYGLKYRLEERKRQEEEYLKQSVQNFFDKLFN